MSHQKLNRKTYSWLFGVIKLYGITLEPEAKNYVMVLDYAEGGSLRNYLNTSYNKLSWHNKICYLYDIALGLKHIHDNEIIHRDLHVSNILNNKGYICITDM